MEAIPSWVISSQFTVHTDFGTKESVEPVGIFSQAIAKYVFNIKRKGPIHKSLYCKAKITATRET